MFRNNRVAFLELESAYLQIQEALLFCKLEMSPMVFLTKGRFKCWTSTTDPIELYSKSLSHICARKGKEIINDFKQSARQARSHLNKRSLKWRTARSKKAFDSKHKHYEDLLKKNWLEPNGALACIDRPLHKTMLTSCFIKKWCPLNKNTVTARTTCSPDQLLHDTIKGTHQNSD